MPEYFAIAGQADTSLRIDRWLYFCRLFKTRSLATASVAGGHVRLNGERSAAGSRIKAGDTIELVRDRLPYRMTVLAIPTRRGPAAEAQACYAEDDATILQRQQLSAALKRDRLSMPRTDGRPDKHTRRKLIDRNRS